MRGGAGRKRELGTQVSDSLAQQRVSPVDVLSPNTMPKAYLGTHTHTLLSSSEHLGIKERNLY